MQIWDDKSSLNLPGPLSGLTTLLGGVPEGTLLAVLSTSGSRIDREIPKSSIKEAVAPVLRVSVDVFCAILVCDPGGFPLHFLFGYKEPS